MVSHYVKIKVESESKIKAINLILKNNIKYSKLKIMSDGDLEIKLTYKDANLLIKELEDNNIQYFLLKSSGLLSKIKRYKYRFGLMLGGLVLIFSVFFSSKMVWRIDVTGNNLLEKEEVVEILEDNGLRLGTFIPRIDYDKLQNEILLSEPHISWISLNISGNTANVQIKETLSTIDSDEEYYSNIVAKADGQIVEIKEVSGKRVVSKNDVVKKGQILISGVIDSSTQGVRYEKAVGEVFALINKKINVEIPLEYQEKVYTGKEYTKRKYKIFSFILNFSINNNKYNKNYDKIETKETVKLFGFIELPVEVQKIKYYEYKYVTLTRTAKEATELAINDINKLIEAETDGAQVLNKDLKTTTENNKIIITCEMDYITDIAKEIKFVVN